MTFAKANYTPIHKYLHQCAHYRRRCKIRAPCCDGIFDCRHCHKEAKASFYLFFFRVQQHCVQCGVCMGNYFCSKCKFFDDDVSKKQYHCDGCGICRLDSFLHFSNVFHCNKCGCCYSKAKKDSNNCVEKAMHHNCPVCFEFLLDTREDITVLRCGHNIHLECVAKSFRDMSRVWEKLDEEVAGTPMPQKYQNKMVWILCNYCGETSQVNFHIVAHKCLKCKSYNTRKTREGPASFSSRITAR
ncbi:RING finger and CHY zinc finger domain-containing protein 1-like [Pyrus ussuriensis x Pyrus communis]|uniref:RING finger and CHY zinc finger domain-containing protein 1-like n=1 Tax=Pyrus ussuriensis x Pyrus communis TaxID=2448454 RepID=A0A5N5H3D1_9ROSA|nr:RING finger and CHY zinc finger domain-containing protein 1-like [Pyrus ussuriensis x Pyrus communis]